MITLHEGGAWLIHGKLYGETAGAALLSGEGISVTPEQGRRGTIADSILRSHDAGGGDTLRLSFDCLASHDITYVCIVQTARASGLRSFPVPYVMTNCHNTLCAVGGTINEDDHLFGLSAARRYGGIFVPPHLGVIHAYVRERHAACGAMVLGSDSHTRYGAMGTMGIGEGGGELVKQMLGKTYDIAGPDIIAVFLKGAPVHGVGPHDVALALIAAVFKNGFVKNRILEFVGEGIAALPMDFRNGIDTMTTETACLSSIWCTDEATERAFAEYGRGEAYRRLAPADVAHYDGAVEIDLDRIEPMIALPSHPSKAMPIRQVTADPGDVFRWLAADGEGPDLTGKVRDGAVMVDQGIVAGCAGGTLDNLTAVADILRGSSVGDGRFGLSVYPASQSVLLSLIRNGLAADIMRAGGIVRSAFCGPCFGAGDTPANGGLSIRHITRNFPCREGAVPSGGQSAFVALMDARSIAATAINGGILTAATEIGWTESIVDRFYDGEAYGHRVFNGFGHADETVDLVMGPNIKNWPSFSALPKHLLLGVAACIDDAVTTTDELIPSGSTSSYRSNPEAMAEFTLSRREPGYVARAKAYREMERERRNGGAVANEVSGALRAVGRLVPGASEETAFGSVLYARKPGDGSAREQAASCQRVLGGAANVAVEYATKRYRSNLINWGILPFTLERGTIFPGEVGDFLFVSDVRAGIQEGESLFHAYVIHKDGRTSPILLDVGTLSSDERAVILAGCLMNRYRNGRMDGSCLDAAL